MIGNLLTEVESNIVSDLKELENLYLDQNTCIDDHFGSDGVPFSKFQKLISVCSKEASREENLKKQVVEMRELEEQVFSLQRLVEKYRSNCGNQSISIPDTIWITRREMP